ncbi:MAG: biotin/lipoate A/B protein ligase family protein [Planctomycetota bacterium]
MNARTARVIRSGAIDPAGNMALDEALLLIPGPPTVRLYQWSPPALSLGYFQRYAELDQEQIRRAGLELVRRPTGGGAIAHCTELTFAITIEQREPPYDGPIDGSYVAVHAAIAAGLARLGAAPQVRGNAVLASDRAAGEFYCFYKSAPVDLIAGERKLLGSAQRRLGGRVLHHGSLPIKQNPITPEASYLEGVLHRELSFDEVAAAVLAGLSEKLRWTFAAAEPTARERELAAQLARAKYRSDSFLRRR